jgi:O-acetylhomoserine (thiol)-lyase
MGAGGHIVASRSLYGGSHNLLDYTLPRFGITTSFVDPRDLDAWRAAIRPETRLLFGETLGNPGLDVLDIPAVSALAHAHGLPLLVDSTFTTPWLMRPFDHGADLVFHSATKFLGGHGVAIGGLLVDSGKFDWDKSGKFPTLTEPYEASTAWTSAEESTVAAFLLRARREGLRDFGACMSPMTAFQLLQGVETLPLRMERHIANTRKRRRPPGPKRGRGHRRLSRTGKPSRPRPRPQLLPRGAGSVFSFVLKGGRPAGRKFIESLRVFSHLANVGDAKSLVIHPASTTHFRMSDEALRASGIHPGTVRLSIGLEDPARPDRRPRSRPRARPQSLIMELRQSMAKRPTPTPAASPSIRTAHRRLHPRRTERPQRLGPAKPLVRPPRLRRPRRGPPRARPQRRRPLPTIQDLADWIELLLERCGAGDAGKNVTLVGHSMGSLTALECASRHPARIARIALIGTAVPMPVSDTLLDAAKNDEPKAIAMINTWSHSPRATIGGYAVPGIWHFGAAQRLMERQKSRRAAQRPLAPAMPTPRHGSGGRPRLPGPDRQRQPRHDDQSQGRRQTRHRNQGRQERKPRRCRTYAGGATRCPA